MTMNAVLVTDTDQGASYVDLNEDVNKVIHSDQVSLTG